MALWLAAAGVVLIGGSKSHLLAAFLGIPSIPEAFDSRERMSPNSATLAQVLPSELQIAQALQAAVVVSARLGGATAIAQSVPLTPNARRPSGLNDVVELRRQRYLQQACGSQEGRTTEDAVWSEALREQWGVGDALVECSVCLCEFDDGAEVGRLPCQHFFHRGCIDQWCQQHSDCPLCRHRFRPDCHRAFVTQ